MDKRKRIGAIIIAIILVLIIVAMILFVVKKNHENVANLNNSEDETENEFVEIMEDDFKINISEKIKNASFNIDGLEIKNIKLSEQAQKTDITADIVNATEEAKGDIGLNITLFDKNGKVIIEIGGYIGMIEAGKTSKLNVSATLDYANAYDINIEKR